MPDTPPTPELKQVIGAILFASRDPVSLNDIRRILNQAPETSGAAARAFADVKPAQVRDAVAALSRDLQDHGTGLRMAEVANRLRLESDPVAAPWLKHMLGRTRRARLSRPALETLAVVAYRQPVTRSEIEAVRGVSVDHIMSGLLEAQLLRIVGRSELPGRPMLYGTTQTFLEHFGLRSLQDLPGVDELSRIEMKRAEDEGGDGEANEDEDDEHDDEDEDDDEHDDEDDGKADGETS